MPRATRQPTSVSAVEDTSDDVAVVADTTTSAAVSYTPAAAPAPQVLQPSTKNAKIKGTWTFFYGGEKYDFVDGYRYDLPLEVFEYLKRAGNIYDTL
jgi:hypothetical protein